MEILGVLMQPTPSSCLAWHLGHSCVKSWFRLKRTCRSTSHAEGEQAQWVQLFLEIPALSWVLLQHADLPIFSQLGETGTQITNT
jgi:hypothetical protein